MKRIDNITLGCGVFLLAALTSCTGGEQGAEAIDADSASVGSSALVSQCEDSRVRELTEEFGTKMKDVSLLAPNRILVRQINTVYAPLVTSELLDSWLSDPPRAPGRQVSSPWPEMITIDSVMPVADASCRVEGELVLVTSDELTGGDAATRIPVSLLVEKNGNWRINQYTERPDEATSLILRDGASQLASDDPADVIQLYYAAIRAGDYGRAYGLWSGSGEASGQSFAEFAEGYAETADVDVEIGTAGRVEGAAGSRYVELPVMIQAETVSGEIQRCEGTYTLRRAVVDGASEEQRQWRIHRAEIACS